MAVTKSGDLFFEKLLERIKKGTAGGGPGRRSWMAWCGSREEETTHS